MTHCAFRRVSKSTKEIIIKMLTKDPMQRICPEKILCHKLFTKKYIFKAAYRNEQTRTNTLNAEKALLKS